MRQARAACAPRWPDLGASDLSLPPFLPLRDEGESSVTSGGCEVSRRRCGCQAPVWHLLP